MSYTCQVSQEKKHVFQKCNAQGGECYILEKPIDILHFVRLIATTLKTKRTHVFVLNSKCNMIQRTTDIQSNTWTSIFNLLLHMGGLRLRSLTLKSCIDGTRFKV
jgi:hypothetical protein